MGATDPFIGDLFNLVPNIEFRDFDTFDESIPSSEDFRTQNTNLSSFNPHLPLETSFDPFITDTHLGIAFV